MVIQREQHRIVMSKEYEDRIKAGCCPVCGKPKEEWKRRKDWTNCSTDCTEEYSKNVIYGWPEMRKKVIERDLHLCQYCKKTIGKYETFVADHIIPIAIGGPQWDNNNLQTLCVDCNKVKTRMDHKTIARERAKERLIKRKQTTLKRYAI